MRRQRRGLITAVLALALIELAVIVAPEASAATGAAPAAVAAVAPAAIFNVHDYGATGNGSSNDTAAINRAIAAANTAGGGTVQFPSGTYRSANTIHMKSNVTLQLDSGSTIRGDGANNYDAPESNQWDNFQDYGHSHFHNAMITGDRLTNIGFVGSGTIDGGGHLITGNPSSGQADKIIALTRCGNLTVNGIRLRRGGHFAMLINGCNGVQSDGLRIDTASDRDGWNVISTTNATITNATIAANDDALVFKSDYALGAKLPNGHVTVTNSHLSAVCCNALMFGSETCGDFTDYQFSQITITGANKSGLGMVSMDGANISDVHYRDITMSGVRSPIMQKIGTRKRCGNSPGVGHISDITYDNITGTGVSPSFSPTLWGEAGGNRISNVAFTNVHLTVPGGNGTMSTGVPSNDPKNYNPNSIGTRPAYGWNIHNATGISFASSSVDFKSGDGRPAVIANSGGTVHFDQFTAERGSNSPHDVGFQSVTGYCVTSSANTSGGALRISASNSTQSCTTPLTAPRFAPALENGLARTPPMGFNNWNATQCTAAFNEAMVKGVADTFVSSGLKAAGYQYVNLDDCWAEPARNANGKLVPNRTRFPNGIKAVADYVHGKGLKLGIYTSAGTKTCNGTGGFPGALGHEASDAAQFASWGVDYLKYDNCNNQGVDAVQRYTAMRDALAATGRPIVYSICEWGRSTPKVWTWGANVGNLWRTTGDISDNWASMISRVHTNDDLAQFAGPGHWNDPDMLEVGNGGMTGTEYRSHFSLWAMMAAPLLIGSDVRTASAATLTILKNADVVAVDQDSLGRQATIVSSSGGLVVYGRQLSNGDRAVALLNETGATATVATTAGAIGLGGSSSYSLKDLWSKSTRTTTGRISASVPSHGTVVYRVASALFAIPASAGPVAAAATTYEAESGTIFHGVVESNHAGFSGTGFVNYNNEVGSYVQFSVTATSAGQAGLEFRYANGTTTNRPMDITVNGKLVAGAQTFGGTGAWTTWATQTINAALTAGTNTIRATATTATGGPNLDRLAVGAPLDTQRPTVPGQPVCGNIGSTSLTLSWGASTDNMGVVAYDIFHDGTQISTAPGSATTADLTGLNANFEYRLSVFARDAAGNVSDSSPLATCTTKPIDDPNPPTAPTNLTHSAVTQTGVHLTWGASTDDRGVTAYLVRDNTSLAVLQTVTGSPPATSTTVPGLTCNTAYRLHVVARDAAGNLSTPSNVTPSFTTGACTRGVPQTPTTVSSGWSIPWDIAWLPNGQAALVTERDNFRVWRVTASGAKTQIGTVPNSQTTNGEGGLLGVAPSPTWNGTTDQAVFFMHTSSDGNRVVKMSYNGSTLSGYTVILSGIRKNRFHNGGRIRFGPDGFLYVTTGEAQQPNLAQDLNSLNGKILRITKTGAAAPGNPFGTLVYSYGHRNPQGIAWDSAGRLWESEFGNATWDEVNLILPGRNYGWPTCEGSCSTAGLENPKWQRAPSVCSCSGVAIVNDTIYLGALRGQRLWRIELNGTSAGATSSYFVSTYGRIRAVEKVPGSNAIWFGTTNADNNGGQPDGSDVIRRSPIS